MSDESKNIYSKIDPLANGIDSFGTFKKYRYDRCFAGDDGNRACKSCRFLH